MEVSLNFSKEEGVVVISAEKYAELLNELGIVKADAISQRLRALDAEDKLESLKRIMDREVKHHENNKGE